MDLLEGSDSDDCNGFRINEDYAKRYDHWRKNEELQKLKDRYGDVEEEESSTSEEEDEDAIELTEEVEKDFFKTLSCLKEKNPIIYNKDVKFFKEKNSTEEVVTKKKPKEHLSIAAYQRNVLLETGGLMEDENPKEDFEDKSIAEQEKLIKSSFKDILKDDDDDDEEGKWGGLFQKKEKTAEENEKEELDYRKWLAGQSSKVEKETESQLKGLHDYWSHPDLDEKEKFLRDYILNQRYLEKDDDGAVMNSESENEDLEDKQEEFERKFNFRFQEPDEEFIKRYPRTVEQSMRKKDDRRKKHREQLKMRKETEKIKKKEELKRLKALKREEILEKIKKLQEITGNNDLGFQEEDVDGDFDPNEHDKRMSELFNEDYYDQPGEQKKPVFEDDDDEELDIENWDSWTGSKEKVEEPHCEDPNFIMDCDYDPSKNELIESTKRRRKRRQSAFAAALAKAKPKFDPANGTFEKYIDEYYSLDYEDLIGDIPCRFKYRKVVPNDYGLDIGEILAAPDQELNRWASVKKIMKRRPEHVEWNEVKIYKKKAENFLAKKKCLPSLYDEESKNSEENEVQKETAIKVKPARETIKKKKHLKESDIARHSSSMSSLLKLSSDRLKSYGVNPKKFKNKIKYADK